MYERVIRDITKNQGFALPYWDWTSNPTMPDVFLQPKTPDGKNNPLYVNDRAFGATWKRTWPPRKPMPADVVGPTVLQQILASTDYEEFGTSRPDGQDNLDPSWVVGGGGVQGVLEGTAHNLVHNNIGGWMPSALSPRDPIFFMHHCNLDRIWAVWNAAGNANSSEQLWTDMPFTNNFFNPDGSFYSPKVSDLFTPETLGYTYGLTAPAAPVAASPRHQDVYGNCAAERDCDRQQAACGIAQCRPNSHPIGYAPPRRSVRRRVFQHNRCPRYTGIRNARSGLPARCSGNEPRQHAISRVPGPDRSDASDACDRSELCWQLRGLCSSRHKRSARTCEAVIRVGHHQRDTTGLWQRAAKRWPHQAADSARGRTSQRSPGRHCDANPDRSGLRDKLIYFAGVLLLAEGSCAPSHALCLARC